jgi:hypothetical protein
MSNTCLVKRLYFLGMMKILPIPTPETPGNIGVASPRWQPAEGKKKSAGYTSLV